ncbi:MAG: CGGC domain-containing protein [Desulfobulbaceae bacterium]|nr:CGGC domain-containing protein [Desulfobulbaceae bacterium]
MLLTGLHNNDFSEENMARIGILTCSNATQDLGCSSVSCLADFRKRKGAFAQYPPDEKLTLVGMINCPGCPTLTGPDKLLDRIRGLTEFKVDTIHLTYCIKSLCPFKEQYRKVIAEHFPDIRVVIGTHEEHITPEEYRQRVKKLFCQPRKSMVDIILDKD